LAFWVVLALLASASPVFTPGGAVVSLSIAPILASTVVLGPAAGGIVAAMGATEWREVRGRIPWYGTLYNHASLVAPAVLAGFVYSGTVGPASLASPQGLAAFMLAGLSYVGLNNLLAAAVIAVRLDRPIAGVLTSNMRSFGLAIVGLAPLSWLMAVAFAFVGPLVAIIFALPLYTTRAAYKSVVEIREMFTQTVRALASAIDARDPSTKKHSENVSTIATDIGRVLGCNESELEQLEWGGLLHDIGKIGVRDAVLLKPGRLDLRERMLMNEHPAKGEEILKGVTKLSPELPLIRHHHEWYNGSGYPDRLIGQAIPYLARILHVADAFEAMTAVRPYRPVPMTNAQALAELRRFAGVQFDPLVVDAFAKTDWATDLSRPSQPEPPARSIPALGQVAALRARESAVAQATAHQN